MSAQGPLSLSLLKRGIAVLALSGVSALGSLAWSQTTHSTQPSQEPLLGRATGANPNLMIALDNSGSMAFTYNETYNVTNDDEYEIRYCPSPYSNVNSTNATAFNSGVGGVAVRIDTTYYCYRRYRSFGVWRIEVRTNDSASYSPRQWEVRNWSAQRSADVNPVYYNPRITYAPRVKGDGSEETYNNLANYPLGIPTNVVFISNQTSVTFDYDVYRNAAGDLRFTHSTRALNPTIPAGYENVYNLFNSRKIPQHIAHTTVDASTPAFTYAYCTNVTTNAAGQQTGCTEATQVVLRHNSTGTIALPSDHQRTEAQCISNTCPVAQEIANIKNWYYYYSTRQLATTTAIGQALQDPAFQSKIRVGYLPINDTSLPVDTSLSNIGNTPLAIGRLPSSSGMPELAADVPLARGVRSLTSGSADNTALYGWLNRLVARGATPLHNVLDRSAQYYRQAPGVLDSPWATNPAAAVSGSNPNLSCRRSYALLFSDGSWTGSAASGGTTATNTGEDDDFEVGTSHTRTLSDGSTQTFQYNPNGSQVDRTGTTSGWASNQAQDRRRYTPFGEAGTGGLADLTAKYYWNEDLSDLDNDIRTRTGQPTFWQNMTTYTVGYMVRPSGEVPGATSGLTFDQIDNYQLQFADPSIPSPTRPSWPTGAMSGAADPARIDDFIQAGYTGGGRAISVQTADEVRAAFKTVLSDILGSSGNDAGVAVSSGGNSSLDGAIKYLVSYNTLDNTGEVSAQELDADGNKQVEKWKGSDGIPAPAARNVFTISDVGANNTPLSFSGNFSALPTDVQAALKHDATQAARIANDASFVNYLRGTDPVADANGALFRQRGTKLAAMVNPPSVVMGDGMNLAYQSLGDLPGSSDYDQYIARKKAAPDALYFATNAGMTHVLDAEDGTELAAFMPRRSLRRMLNYANTDYTFEYVLDGPISEHDMDFGTGSGTTYQSDWQHVAIGTGGRGERLIYALRSPLRNGANMVTGTQEPDNRQPNVNDFLWEVGPDSSDIAAETNVRMGYITTPVQSGVVGRLLNKADGTKEETGQWVVITTSGHYNDASTRGKQHGLFVLDAASGALVKAIPLPSSADAGDGMGGVTLVRDTNRRVVAAYAGDANGNLWRFNLRSSNPDNWSVSYDQPVFTTNNNRPIYGAPAWQQHPEGGTIVVVATGKLLDKEDLDDTDTNSIYGIWDPTVVGASDAPGFSTRAFSKLLQQQVTTTTVRDDADLGRNYFAMSENVIENWEDQGDGSNFYHGWYVNLGNTLPLSGGSVELTGERSISDVMNISNRVVVSTTVAVPDTATESCSSNEGVSLVYILNALDGRYLPSFRYKESGTWTQIEANIMVDASGGFARNNALQKFGGSDSGGGSGGDTGGAEDFSPSSSTAGETALEKADPDPTDNPNPCIGDECDSPLPSDPTGCEEQTAALMGTNDQAEQISLTCEGGPPEEEAEEAVWQRTQYQLNRPATAP